MAKALTTPKKIKILKVLAEENGWKFCKEYSGRFMYGTTCAGIITSSPEVCIKKASKEGIRCAKIDNMGMNYIVYWTNVPTTKEED